MQIAAEQLPAQLQRGLHTLYTIHGNEPLLVQSLKSTYRQASQAKTGPPCCSNWRKKAAPTPIRCCW